MSNKRVYFPIHYLALGAHGSQSGIPVHGLQSLDTETSFDLEQVNELGQLEAYANIEALPQVQITAEKVLDGYPLIYHLATPEATSSSLANRTNSRCDAIMSIFSDGQDSASGTPVTQVYCSGMYVNDLTYTLAVDGNFTESVTLVGNDRIWKESAFYFDGHFDGNDSPAHDILRRQHVIMGGPGSGGSKFPSNIPGMTVSGGVGYNEEVNGEYVAHVQTITISTSLGREDIFELGRKAPYYRYASFPTTIDCTIEMNTGGAFAGDGIDADSTSASNLSEETIYIKLDDNTVFDLGTKNKLQSVTQSGGGTDGSLQTASYTYQNLNKLDVIHPQDPYVGA